MLGTPTLKDDLQDDLQPSSNLPVIRQKRQMVSFGRQHHIWNRCGFFPLHNSLGERGTILNDAFTSRPGITHSRRYVLFSLFLSLPLSQVSGLARPPTERPGLWVPFGRCLSASYYSSLFGICCQQIWIWIKGYQRQKTDIAAIFNRSFSLV